MTNPTLGSTARPAGRRERNKQRVRERIYNAAITMFAERGYDETSIDDIAERADVARGTFFNYFQRKEDLAVAWGEHRRDQMQDRVARHIADVHGNDTVARLAQCMQVLAEINEEERAITPTMLMVWVKAGRPILEEPYAGQIFAEIIRDGQAYGEVAPGISSETVGNALRDVYLGALYRWSRPGGESLDLNSSLQSTLRIFLTGILVPAPADPGPRRPGGDDQ